MATIDISTKLVNEATRAENLGNDHPAIWLPVTHDQYFTFNQNGVSISRIVANVLIMGSNGTLAVEMAHTANNQPIVSYFPAVFQGQHIRGYFKRVLSTSALGNTTVTNITWGSGE
jgi:hypothetical protein